ncbi:Neuroendocrine convertase 1 [Acropora cervicornis]|uniref:Neuroendocrine convertase 1 n=1 Tax=Acropora cervicornis TaxID=6130 RepID=A0AAD9QV63_ACRCE|nr:Neuroendocrine convertase 1 [Acropora cervicornis]
MFILSSATTTLLRAIPVEVEEPIVTSQLFLFASLFTLATCNGAAYSNTWVIQLDGGKTAAERIAFEKDMTLLGQVGSLEGFYMFKHNSHPRRSRRAAEDLTTDLYEHPNVIWADQQIIKRRVKREFNPHFDDPDYNKQWYLHNTNEVFKGYDHNVLPVWEQGVTGKGVVVSILDDDASYDFNSNDADPEPRPTWNDENRHGTRCAGEVAAVSNNSVCGVGVAPGARVGGVRMLDGDVTDAVEGSSLSLNPQKIDLYSSSWGPDDDGRTGRGGLGSIYVWASGNGGRSKDSCSCDGYTNSIYTLSISSATEHGSSPWYSEPCASTLATTFSSGGGNMRKIVTTDLHGRSET